MITDTKIVVVVFDDDDDVLVILGASLSSDLMIPEDQF